MNLMEQLNRLARRPSNAPPVEHKPRRQRFRRFKIIPPAQRMHTEANFKPVSGARHRVWRDGVEYVVGAFGHLKQVHRRCERLTEGKTLCKGG